MMDSLARDDTTRNESGEMASLPEIRHPRRRNTHLPHAAFLQLRAEVIPGLPWLK